MVTHWNRYLGIGLVLGLAGVVAGGCGPVGADTNNNYNSLDRNDDDGDGFSEAAGDCDDHNPAINPNAQEVIDGIDNNCDGKIDEDLDGDGWSVTDGDCNDNDPAINPMAGENCNDGIDNNCNGFIDGDEPDKDGDGFGPCDTPWGDCNDNEILISPAAVEDLTDGLDNDCDGLVDDQDTNDFDCDCQAAEPGETLEDQMLKALGMCNRAMVQSVSFNNSDPVAYGAYGSWGSVVPRTSGAFPAVEGLAEQNCKFVVLSTGHALASDPQDDMTTSDLGITANDPAPTPDGAEIHDLTQLAITLIVPVNVTGFSFDFIFFSSEYPEYVCTDYNDTFYALVEGDPALNGGSKTNVSFDSNNQEITVNNNFFEYNIPPWSINITGTGYEVADPYADWAFMPTACTPPSYAAPQYVGSMSGWLRTTSPLTPGETVTLTFSIHDEGDGILDSAVVIDNFRWQTVPIDGPGTVK